MTSTHPQVIDLAAYRARRAARTHERATAKRHRYRTNARVMHAAGLPVVRRMPVRWDGVEASYGEHGPKEAG